MKKILNILSIVGLAIFTIGFLWSWYQNGTALSFTQGHISTYLIYGGVLMTLPLYFYKFIHFNEYRKENLANIAYIGIVLIIIFFYIFLKK